MIVIDLRETARTRFTEPRKHATNDAAANHPGINDFARVINKGCAWGAARNVDRLEILRRQQHSHKAYRLQLRPDPLAR